MTIEKLVIVPLDAEQTFALLTEPEGMRRWQVLSARVDLRAGGDFRWTVVPGANAGGTFVEVEPGKRLVYTFGWEGDDTRSRRARRRSRSRSSRPRAAPRCTSSTRA